VTTGAQLVRDATPNSSLAELSPSDLSPFSKAASSVTPVGATVVGDADAISRHALRRVRRSSTAATWKAAPSRARRGERPGARPGVLLPQEEVDRLRVGSASALSGCVATSPVGN
jgi:hypothetical protein